MPIVQGKIITPDEAMAMNLCPECGVDLTTVNPIAHRNSHWLTQPKLDRRGAEALRRRTMLDDFITKHNVRTTNMPKRAATEWPMS